MTLEDINYMAQIVGVAAVMGSLIFVGIEVRQNSAITRAQVHQQLSDTFTAYLETLAEHADLVATGTSSKAGLRNLNNAELLRFSFLMAGLFKIWENGFYQHKNGFLDAPAWESNVQWMLTWYHLPGVRTWWSVRKDLFAGEFRMFVETMPEPAETRAIATRLRTAASASSGAATNGTPDLN